MTGNPKAPLSKADIANARKALATLRDLEAEIERAERVGVDVAEYRARHEHLKGSLQAILDEYERNPDQKS